jgi:hypothetical protein
MKNSLIAGMAALAILTSCEKPGRDVIFAINDNLEFRISDISLYDSSANILYLKRSHSELDDIESGSFAFYDRGEPVMSGSFWPGYRSSSPTCPVVMTCPLSLQTFALKFETWFSSDRSEINNDRLTDLMRRNGLLHSGLSVTATAPVISGAQMSFTFTVSNKDDSGLLILDPEKTGPGLFRYFTNGLYLYNPDNGNEVFADNIPHVAPDPWNSWSMDWLTELEPGESRTFTFTYTPVTMPAPGEYKVMFRFPGLSHQVSEGDLYQGESRIWLGGILFCHEMTIL